MQSIPNTSAELSERELTESFPQEGIEILRARIRYPVVMYGGAPGSAAAISHYYNQFAEGYLRFVRAKLLPAARRAYVQATRFGAPIVDFTAEQRCEMTFNRGYVSGYIEQYEKEDGGAGHIRYGETFELSSGKIMRLRDFFLPGGRWKRVLVSEVQRIIEGQRKSGASFSENAARLAKSKIRPEQFYLTERGVTIFYPEGALAPRHSGILAFLVPYERLREVLKYDLAGEEREREEKRDVPEEEEW